ncbi:intelectin-like isoform X2 [Pimephales promelas]|uniref:intelectin-like isoform X2 n=1 Tax=Pimephales promelas TaxID=90988 RepID=UPI00195580B2|nr:intelectin-like isoform X2 [Pimephales promelas]
MFLTKTFFVILFSLSLNVWLCETATVILLDQQEDIKTVDINLGKAYAARSCKELQKKYHVKDDGLYYLNSSRGVLYQTFCDMTTAGGGWTLVASVHENNIYGKCTVGDRWSSQQGSEPKRPDGEGTWANTVTFGSADASTSDDYKNPGYFDIPAQDVSVWHVPNNMEVESWSASSILRYHSENHFLTLHGGNLYNLFKQIFSLDSSHSESLIMNGQPWLCVQVPNQPTATLNISVLVEVDTFPRRPLGSAGTLRDLTGMLRDGALLKRSLKQPCFFFIADTHSNLKSPASFTSF